MIKYVLRNQTPSMLERLKNFCNLQFCKFDSKEAVLVTSPYTDAQLARFCFDIEPPFLWPLTDGLQCFEVDFKAEPWLHQFCDEFSVTVMDDFGVTKVFMSADQVKAFQFFKELDDPNEAFK